MYRLPSVLQQYLTVPRHQSFCRGRLCPRRSSVHSTLDGGARGEAKTDHMQRSSINANRKGDVIDMAINNALIPEDLRVQVVYVALGAGKPLLNGI